MVVQRLLANVWQNVAIPGPLTADGGGFPDGYPQPPPRGGVGQPACP
jgi:hypothetical protein